MPLDLRRRVFVKVARPSLRDQLLLMAQSRIEAAALPIDHPLRLWEAALQTAPTARIVLDPTGVLIMAAAVAHRSGSE